MEDRALVQFSLRPDSASMFLHDALHRRQADARAFKILRTMQSLEDPKQFVDILHVEADAVVADREHRLPIVRVFRLTDLNDRGISGAGKLKGVGEEVLKDLLD